MDSLALQNLVGQTVVARIPPVEETQPTMVKILAVETGGIWIESQKLTDHFLAESGATASPKTLVFFLPFQQVAWIVWSVDYPALSEKGLGV